MNKERQKGAVSGGRRRRAPVILALLFVLAGLALVAYPYVSDYLNKVEQAKVTQTQQTAVDNSTDEELEKQLDEARAYNKRLLAGRVRVTDPFDPDAKTTSNEEYESMLNIAGDGVMGQITIPSIGVDLPIYHGVTGDGMDHGVGHMPETSLPVGGESTHAVLAGHTGLPSARIFDRLDELKEGDWFIITVLGEELAYRVTSTEVVLPDETESLAIQDGKDLVTLITCTPYGVNTHRLLVHAERCDIPDEWKAMKESGGGSGTGETADLPMIGLTALGIGLGVLVFAIILLVLRARRKHAAKAEASAGTGRVTGRAAGHASAGRARVGHAMGRGRASRAKRGAKADVPEMSRVQNDAVRRHGASLLDEESGKNSASGKHVEPPKHGKHFR